MCEALLMKLCEVRERLGLSREQVYGLARRGEIVAVRVGGQRMYRRDSVDGWVERVLAETED